LSPFQRIQNDLDFIREKKTMGMFKRVDLILNQGKASFVNEHTVEAGGREITADKIFICTGTRPEIPPFPGIEQVHPLTNETMFSLDRIPEKLIVIGGGAIACEMAQAFSRLGSKVTILYRGPRLLKREDPDAAICLEKTFTDEGIQILHNETPQRFSVRGENIIVATGQNGELVTDKVLVAAGRRMEFSALQLERAGIAYSEKGIKVDAYLRTSQPHIYAPGDCNGHHLFSHAAMHQGMVALCNCMMPRPMRIDFRKFVVPSTIFTDPQISRVGASEHELRKRGLKFETITVPYADYGAAIAEKVDTGFVKVLTSRWGKIYGATVVGEGSSDMINEWGLAVQEKVRMHKLLFLQHSFPSMSFLNKRAAETWMMNIMQSSALMRKMSQIMFRGIFR
ncbi:MAG TPA: FAD-dependent oxidoreductase, partial [Oligoflexia bacterium]|nr:FAD-dependent oxidoreductase [Oligoflexia bacterium]